MHVLVTNDTTILTPATFHTNGCIWEFDQIGIFYKVIESSNIENPVVVDIGAQTGLYTLLAKYLPKATFYSFEPYKPCYLELCKNIKINNIKNVLTYEMAVSDDCKEKILKVPDHKGLNTLGRNPIRFDVKESEKFTVECTTLDSMFYDKKQKVDFIKCDTEGWEYYVLKGGLNTIKKYKPVLQLEYNETNMNQCDVDKSQYNNLLSNLGYKLYYSCDEENIYKWEGK